MQGHGMVAVSTLYNGLDMEQHIIAPRDHVCKHPWLGHMSLDNEISLSRYHFVLDLVMQGHGVVARPQHINTDP